MRFKWLRLSFGLSGDVSMRGQAPLVDMTEGIIKKTQTSTFYCEDLCLTIYSEVYLERKSISSDGFNAWQYPAFNGFQ